MGAWEFGYYRRGFTPTTNQQIAGCHAVKKALVDSGHGTGINLTVNLFGDAAASRAADFQKAHGLEADGVVGPTTARYLWRTYVSPAELTFQIPDHWLGKLATLESNNDPVAQGSVDLDDHGLVQINARFHPELSLSEAWAPAFIVPWAANYLQRARVSLGFWTAAIASWNVGLTYARAWAVAGFPKTGGPTLGTEDVFARATRYVELVSQQPH